MHHVGTSVAPAQFAAIRARRRPRPPHPRRPDRDHHQPAPHGVVAASRLAAGEPSIPPAGVAEARVSVPPAPPISQDPMPARDERLRAAVGSLAPSAGRPGRTVAARRGAARQLDRPQPRFPVPTPKERSRLKQMATRLALLGSDSPCDPSASTTNLGGAARANARAGFGWTRLRNGRDARTRPRSRAGQDVVDKGREGRLGSDDDISW